MRKILTILLSLIILACTIIPTFAVAPKSEYFEGAIIKAEELKVSTPEEETTLPEKVTVNIKVIPNSESDKFEFSIREEGSIEDYEIYLDSDYDFIEEVSLIPGTYFIISPTNEPIFTQTKIEITSDKDTYELTPVTPKIEETTVDETNTEEISENIQSGVTIHVNNLAFWDKMSFTLVSETGEKYKIAFNGKNDYTNVIELPIGTYTITDIEENASEGNFILDVSEIIITNPTDAVELYATTFIPETTFLSFLKDNLFFIIVFTGLIIALAVVKIRNGENLIDFDKLTKKRNSHHKE